MTLFWIQADLNIKGESGKPVIHLTDPEADAGLAICGARMPLDVAGVIAFDKAVVKDKGHVCHGCLRMADVEVEVIP